MVSSLSSLLSFLLPLFPISLPTYSLTHEPAHLISIRWTLSHTSSQPGSQSSPSRPISNRTSWWVTTSQQVLDSVLSLPFWRSGGFILGIWNASGRMVVLVAWERVWRGVIRRSGGGGIIAVWGNSKGFGRGWMDMESDLRFYMNWTILRSWQRDIPFLLTMDHCSIRI